MCIVNSFPLDVHYFNEQSGSQSYVPPDEQDGKALAPALDLLDGAKSNPAFLPNPKSEI
jgi:carboxyl-terminal processing protease